VLSSVFGCTRALTYNTSQLLQRLEKATSRKTLAKVALEAVDVSGLAERQLVLVVGSDLSELLNEGRVLHVKLAQLGERLGSVLGLALLDVPSGGLGDEDAANKHDDGPRKLHRNGDTVGAGVVAVLGGVVDNSSDQQTDGNGELVAANNSTTDPLGRGFRLVERDGCRNHADSVASEETTGNEEGNISGDGLENDTDAEDNIGSDQTIDTTKEISCGGGGESTEKGTSGQDRDDERLLIGSDIKHVILGVDITGREELPPVCHTKNTTNGTGIVTVDVRLSLDHTIMFKHTRREHHQRRRTGRS